MIPELTAFLPAPVVPWLSQWGLFLLALGAVFLLLRLGLRKFFLWQKGTQEVLVYLKRLTELQEKSLLELEQLNRTLKMPLKKAPSAGPPKAEIPVPSQERDALLAALQAARKKARPSESTGTPPEA